MPVIIIGADTRTGDAILTALRDREGEVRVFVTDETVGESLRRTEVKVAVGDLSDASHIEGACTNVFCAVLVTEAAFDGRDLAFGSPDQVIAGWSTALQRSNVSRALWVGSVAAETADASAPEVAVVMAEGRSVADVAAEIAALDDALQI
jgi:putative NADH-flavin reductase